MIVGGDPIEAKAALEHGLIDEIIAGDLRAGAVAFAERISDQRPLPRVRDLPPPSLPDTNFFAASRADTAKRKPGLNAPQACIDALEASLLPIDEGLRREQEIFGGTIFSDQARALRHLFFAEREAAKVPGLAADTPIKNIASVGVIGGGTMGSAIAICCADAGLPVTLVEADKLALDRSLGNIRAHYEGAVKRGRLEPDEMEKRLARLRGAMLLSDLGSADLIIEAVTEELALKCKNLRRRSTHRETGCIDGEQHVLPRPRSVGRGVAAAGERARPAFLRAGDRDARDGSRARGEERAAYDRHRHGIRAQDPQDSPSWSARAKASSAIAC